MRVPAVVEHLAEYTLWLLTASIYLIIIVVLHVTISNKPLQDLFQPDNSDHIPKQTHNEQLPLQPFGLHQLHVYQHQVVQTLRDVHY